MIFVVVKVYKDADAIGKAAAALFAARVIEKPDCVLGLATGSTPIPTYKAMAELYKAGAVDYSKVTTYNLDEYVGLGHEHDQSYYYFMHDNLFKYINVPEENVNVLSGTAKDLEAECASYEERIQKSGGIDLQILGIGHNGHIAFNEPDDAFAPVTHVVSLTARTIEANTRFFASSADVPRQAVSMGIGTIMKAKAIVLVATGAGKAQAVHDMVYGEITPQCPASILQLHPNVTIMVDKEAGSML